ncbi:MAG: indole-3-glycerol phosphate synthase TrpC [Alphaproteobacteria bacterium]|nr:indole-3-glycerol phosphate synthase TrpC [Alphaproteobacteria bacterium]MCB9794395.1 indole-3-glycerol phosphate synthase TrpC [Alphaproteobacteria bacterium]
MSFLDRIAPEKQAEVAALRAAPPAGEGPPVRSLRAALSAAGLQAISEVKRRSPSRGDIRPGADAAAIAQSYVANGAAAISVLTDGPHFGGQLADLRAVRAAVPVPVLRKDFLIDPLQVAEARDHGADAVLLIVAMLSQDQLVELLAATRALGMEALVETHDAPELERALAAGASVVGVNNRDLKSLAIDLATCERLLPGVPEGVLKVAESGLKSPADLLRMQQAGADAVLVGSSLMSAPSPGEALGALLGRR